MAYAKNETVIDRPIEDVFGFLADGENNAAWRGAVLEVARTSALTGTGATYRQVIAGPRGRRIRHDYEVTEHEAPTTLAFRHRVGLARPRGRFDLAERGGATLVGFELSWSARGPRRLLDSMIGAWMAAEVDRLDLLRQVLEDSHGPAGAGR